MYSSANVDVLSLVVWGPNPIASSASDHFPLFWEGELHLSNLERVAPRWVLVHWGQSKYHDSFNLFICQCWCTLIGCLGTKSRPTAIASSASDHFPLFWEGELHLSNLERVTLRWVKFVLYTMSQLLSRKCKIVLMPSTHHSVWIVMKEIAMTVLALMGIFVEKTNCNYNRAEEEFNTFESFKHNKPIGPTARKSVQGCLLYHL